MLLRSQHLYHDICQVVGRNIGEFQFLTGVKVSAVVELHIDVLVPNFPVSSWLDVIQYVIGISADKERTSEFPDNVCVELGKPLGFSSSFWASDVFGFHGGVWRVLISTACRISTRLVRCRFGRHSLLATFFR